MEKTSKNHVIPTNIYVILLLIMVILAFFVGFGINTSHGFFRELSNKKIIQNIQTETKVYVPENSQVAIREISIPAISSDETGIAGRVVVIIKKGTGLILTDVGNILLNEDTEYSARTAAYYAFKYTKKDLNKYDVVYHIDIDAPAIEGASAGAALTIATISALLNYTLNNDVIITGTINHDGTIGPAKGLTEKAEAAKSLGKSLFLVPYTQSELIETTTEDYCQIYGKAEFCAAELTSKKINLSEQTGISIKEVKTIQDALNYLVISK